MAAAIKDIPARAKDFCVWREANAVNWDCSVAELAEATGFSPSLVRTILKRRGWSARAGYRRTGFYDTPRVDQFFKRSQDRCRKQSPVQIVFAKALNGLIEEYADADDQILPTT